VLHIFINQWFYQKISSSTLSFQTFQVREAPANQEPQVIAGHIQSDAPSKITGYHKHIPCKKKQLEKTQLHTYIYIYKSIKLASPKYQVFFCSSAVLNRSRKDLPGMAKLRYSKVWGTPFKWTCRLMLPLGLRRIVDYQYCGKICHL
jgi:hypothetical protein